MFKKVFIGIISILLFILLAVIYNYILAQKAIRETKASTLFTDIISFPESIVMGKEGTFIWTVDTPSDLTTSYTAIYWSQYSSPSALTVTDSPSAVGYENHSKDFLTGKYKLPDNFDTKIIFPQSGKMFFRTYAKVKDQHLWSKEYSLIVEPSGYVNK